TCCPTRRGWGTWATTAGTSRSSTTQLWRADQHHLGSVLGGRRVGLALPRGEEVGVDLHVVVGAAALGEAADAGPIVRPPVLGLLGVGHPRDQPSPDVHGIPLAEVLRADRGV